MDLANQRASYRVFLLGASLQSTNRGVRALADATIGLIAEARPGCHVTLYESERANADVRYDWNATVEVLAYRFSTSAGLCGSLLWLIAIASLYRLLPLEPLRARIRNAHAPIRAIAEADVVGSIWGGDSFSDIYGLSRFAKRMLPHALIFLIGSPLVLLPQTFGPFEHPIARRMALMLFRRASAVYARDHDSLALAREMLDAADSVVEARSSPDVAFALPVVRPEPLPIEPPIPLGDGRPLIGLNVSGLLFRGGYTGKNMFDLRAPYSDSMKALIYELIESLDARILLVPHVLGSSNESDAPACDALFEEVSVSTQGRIHRVRGEWDQRELKGIIGLCDGFVGARMHACIAALSQGIPAVGIAYSRKFRGVFASVGVPDLVVDPRELDTGELVAACRDRLLERRDYRMLLEKELSRARAVLSREFDRALVGRGA